MKVFQDVVLEFAEGAVECPLPPKTEHLIAIEN